MRRITQTVLMGILLSSIAAHGSVVAEEKPMSAKYESWYFLGVFNAAAGYGNGTDIGYGKPSSSGSLLLRGGDVGFGIPGLGSLGLGTVIYEYMSGAPKAAPGSSESPPYSSLGLPNSWFPIYLHYLVYSKIIFDAEETHGDIAVGKFYRSPCILLSFGGSTWAPDDYRYLRVSLSLTWSGSGDVFGHGVLMPLNFGFEAGLILSSAYISQVPLKVPGNSGFYVVFRIGLGATFPYLESREPERMD